MCNDAGAMDQCAWLVWEFGLSCGCRGPEQAKPHFAIRPSKQAPTVFGRENRRAENAGWDRTMFDPNANSVPPISFVILLNIANSYAARPITRLLGQGCSRALCAPRGRKISQSPSKRLRPAPPGCQQQRYPHCAWLQFCPRLRLFRRPRWHLHGPYAVPEGRCVPQ